MLWVDLDPLLTNLSLTHHVDCTEIIFTLLRCLVGKWRFDLSTVASSKRFERWIQCLKILVLEFRLEIRRFGAVRSSVRGQTILIFCHELVRVSGWCRVVYDTRKVVLGRDNSPFLRSFTMNEMRFCAVLVHGISRSFSKRDYFQNPISATLITMVQVAEAVI